MQINTQSIQISPNTQSDLIRSQRASNELRQRTESLEGFMPQLQRSMTRNPSSQEIQAEIKADPERKKLYEASQEFQAIFLNQMLSAMRKTVNKDNDLLNGGRTQEIFEDFLYDEYAKSMSRQPGFTLSDEIYRQLSANMGPARPAGSLTPSVSSEELARDPFGR
jgi:flagellar protein FlgJ